MTSRASDAADLDAILADGGPELCSVYQPIVDLMTGQTVAFEALARGPRGSALELPGALFGSAAAAGRIEELDRACRMAALRGTRGSGIAAPASLFVNIEPVAVGDHVHRDFASYLAQAPHDVRVVFELTERALTSRPAEVLAVVAELRALGAGIALDDVGVDPRSLALLPFVRPDVVKLDMSVVQGPATPEVAQTMHAVGAYAEETRARVLAEGIEDAGHAAKALALGATLGQGWHFGRPGPAPEPGAAVVRAASGIGAWLPRRVDGIRDDRTPFQLACDAGLELRVADKRLILALSKQLEAQAIDLGPSCVVLANLQHAERFSARTRARYAQLGEQASFVGVVGQAVEPRPVGRVRGGAFPTHDPLVREWTVCVLSPHFAAAMLARDLGDCVDDMDRRFEFTLTYRRDLVSAAAAALMRRIPPLP